MTSLHLHNLVRTQNLFFSFSFLCKYGTNIRKIFLISLIGKRWKLIGTFFISTQWNNENSANQNTVTKLSRHRPLILKPLALGTLLLIHGQERFTIHQDCRKVQIFWGASSKGPYFNSVSTFLTIFDQLFRMFTR